MSLATDCNLLELRRKLYRKAKVEPALPLLSALRQDLSRRYPPPCLCVGLRQCAGLLGRRSGMTFAAMGTVVRGELAGRLRARNLISKNREPARSGAAVMTPKPDGGEATARHSDHAGDAHVVGSRGEARAGWKANFRLDFDGMPAAIVRARFWCTRQNRRAGCRRNRKAQSCSDRRRSRMAGNRFPPSQGFDQREQECACWRRSRGHGWGPPATFRRALPRQLSNEPSDCDTTPPVRPATSRRAPCPSQGTSGACYRRCRA